MGSRAKKVATIIWSVGLGIALLVLTVSVMLPSTKRASPEMLRMWEQRDREERERDVAATQGSTTMPTFAPVTVQPDSTSGGHRLLLPSSKVGIIIDRQNPHDPVGPADIQEIPAIGPTTAPANP
jgi:hypothetical protein